MTNAASIELDALHQSIIDECEHIRTLMQTHEDDEVIDTAFQEFLDKRNDFLSKKQTEYADVYVTFYSFSTIIENHIRLNHTEDVKGGMDVLMEMIFSLEQSPFSEQQIKSLRNVLYSALREAKIFMNSKNSSKSQIQYARHKEQKCLLCRKKDATQTWSHLIPHFLIQRFFSYDGSSKRDKEVVESFSLMDGDNKTYIGKRTSPKYIEEILGHEMSDEEVIREDRKRSLLIRDYYFCPDCEKRFSVLEEAYADIIKNPQRDYPVKVPYLFWLSVIWRMSVGRLAIHMLPEHEQRVRKVLNEALNIEKQQLVETQKLGHFAYRLSKAEDMKGETSCVMGIHDAVIPYSAIIGDYVLCFYPNLHKARVCAKRTPFDMSAINDGCHNEVVSNMSFIDFWYTKQEMYKEIYKHPSDYAGDSVQDLVRFQSHEEIVGLEDVFGIEESPFLLTNDMLKNSYFCSIPNSIAKIINCIKNSDKESSKEEKLKDIMKETGYTAEEIEFMLDYTFGKRGKEHPE